MEVSTMDLKYSELLNNVKEILRIVKHPELKMVIEDLYKVLNEPVRDHNYKHRLWIDCEVLAIKVYFKSSMIIKFNLSNTIKNIRFYINHVKNESFRCLLNDSQLDALCMLDTK
uniref:Uncharacterized protein n=1 Tax=viral metagenome TaxID=1070528 RepID=A0A6C0JSS5_9ZZZZ